MTGEDGQGVGVDGSGGTAETGVLARKAAQGRAGAPQPVAMTAPRALALALTRAADGLPLRVAAVQARNLSLADLPEAIMDQPLIAVVEGPGEGLGIVALCPVVVASLIEAQTIGRLSHRPVVARRPTRTDAALAAPFVDALLAGLEDLLAKIAGQEWVAGYRYASFLDDPRPLGLMLEDGALRGLDAEVVLGADGQRQGRLMLALPARPRRAGDHAHAAPIHPAAQAAEAAATRAARRWSEGLHDQVMGAEVALTAVLARLHLPAATLMGLAPGMMLPLPEGADRALTLEAGGRALATARLGQHRGARALRLCGPGAAEGADPLALPVAAAVSLPEPAPLPEMSLPDLPMMPFDGDAVLAPLTMRIEAAS